MYPIRTMAALHRVVRLTLALALVVSTQSLLLVQGAFQLRKDLIIERFCVNVERPEVECEARCYLTERLRQEQRREQQAAFLEVLLAFSLLVPLAPALAAPSSRPVARGAEPPRAAPEGARAGVFHPPRGRA